MKTNHNLLNDIWTAGMRSGLLGLLFLAWLAIVPGRAAAEVFPADTEWLPLTQNGQGIGDPLSDGQGNGREIVGDPASPAFYF